ncbi:hypothetical protein WAF17_13645 [Bernardetia sp. ABR2-2B]|uniref:hypothetical protein n=1 Tax=Bernardetia sp. ABR2-2B TaxID=3127472 RepID=UPI0030CB65E0
MIPISDSLVHKISVSNTENYEENEKLLSLLSSEISEYSKKENDIGGGNVLYIIYDNLDTDEDIELIAFTGTAWESDFFVFDRIDNQWFMIHKGTNNLANGQDTHYGVSPTKNIPLVWMKYHDGGGTGLKINRYFFYKLLGNNFKKVLELAGKHSLSSGSMLYLNLDLNTEFYTYSSGKIEAIITSKFYIPYRKYRGAKLEYITLYETNMAISFEWNKEKEAYFPVFSKDSNLSKKQQKFLLLQEENQNLFYQLFKAKVQETRKKLSKEKIKILDEWIEIVKKK